jgi:hypothetical protein
LSGRAWDYGEIGSRLAISYILRGDEEKQQTCEKERLTTKPMWNEGLQSRHSEGIVVNAGFEAKFYYYDTGS